MECDETTNHVCGSCLGGMKFDELWNACVEAEESNCTEITKSGTEFIEHIKPLCTINDTSQPSKLVYYIISLMTIALTWSVFVIGYMFMRKYNLC